MIALEFEYIPNGSLKLFTAYLDIDTLTISVAIARVGVRLHWPESGLLLTKNGLATESRLRSTQGSRRL